MKPLVSVCLITYNHSKYIRQAIDSILMQQVHFDWELIIADDFSTDGTREILEEYKNRHTNFIQLILQPTNVGSINNWLQLLSAANNKYIACIDGDDYWTDEYKLQKQIDFLEANPEFSLCFHPVKLLENNGQIVDDYITKVPKNYQCIENLARYGNYIHTPSVVFRNCIKEYPKTMLQSPVGDYYLYMLLSQHGKIFRLDETMAIYRNGTGTFSSQNLHAKYFKALITFLLIHDYFNIHNRGIAKIFKKRIIFLFFRLLPFLKPKHMDELKSMSSMSIIFNKNLLKFFYTTIYIKEIPLKFISCFKFKKYYMK